ncbi:MAG: signal peptidase II [Candidatus Palauibacterales bacterium]|nr:signal peptidase II [Candidatus Palauibacterales bacterium]
MSSDEARRDRGDEPREPGSAGGPGKGWLLAAVAGTILVLDRITKRWIVENLTLHEIVPVWGDFFRLTYTHNFGAAFGINVGEYSRVFFLTLAVLALGVLMYLYMHTSARRRLRLWALALVSGGAVGNIIDRIRYQAGVVDFLDVGVGSTRWPVFNVADMAVSVGAVLLMITFYREETERRSENADEAATRDAARARGASGPGGDAADERVPAGEG